MNKQSLIGLPNKNRSAELFEELKDKKILLIENSTSVMDRRFKDFFDVVILSSPEQIRFFSNPDIVVMTKEDKDGIVDFDWMKMNAESLLLISIDLCKNLKKRNLRPTNYMVMCDSIQEDSDLTQVFHMITNLWKWDCGVLLDHKKSRWDLDHFFLERSVIGGYKNLVQQDRKLLMGG